MPQKRHFWLYVSTKNQEQGTVKVSLYWKRSFRLYERNKERNYSYKNFSVNGSLRNQKGVCALCTVCSTFIFTFISLNICSKYVQSRWIEPITLRC